MEALDRERRYPRYAANVEVHVAHGGRHIATLTREISARGLFFFADPTPEVDERVRLTIYGDGYEPFPVNAVVRYAMPGVGAGVEVDAAPPEAAERFASFVEEQAMRSETWRVIGGHVRADEDPGPEDLEFEPKELIEVGETCEAFRVFFERYPPIPPEQSALKDDPQALQHAKLIITGVSSDPVEIKLHPRDRLRKALLGVMPAPPGFVAIVKPPRQPTAFYSLSGRELLMIQSGGRPVFPFFTTGDLARIRRDLASPIDSGRRRSISSLTEEGTISTRYAKAQAGTHRAPLEGQASGTTPAASSASSVMLSQWTRFDSDLECLLMELFEILGAETRVYAVGAVERPVRLIRNMTLFVRTAGASDEDEALLLHDGKHLCAIFGVRSRQPMRVHRLTSADEIRVPAW